MKNILFVLVVIISTQVFAEGLNAFFLEAAYYSDTAGDNLASLERAKANAITRASTSCKPLKAIRLSDWQTYKKHTTTFNPTMWVGTTFTCGETQDDVVCKKVGTTYIVKCCDNIGSCWIE